MTNAKQAPLEDQKPAEEMPKVNWMAADDWG
jgi:hypothetical protein